MLICNFLEGRGSEKVYVLYTHLNLDNYGWPLINISIKFNVMSDFHIPVLSSI